MMNAPSTCAPLPIASAYRLAFRAVSPTVIDMSATTATVRSLPRRFAFRLVAAMLLVALPLSIIEGLLLTSRASKSLAGAGEARGVNVARAETLRVEDWLEERREGVSLLANTLGGPARVATMPATLRSTVAAYSDDYSVIEVTDLTGKVLASSDPKLNIQPGGARWFRTALSNQPSLTSVTRVGTELQWIIAQPMVDSSGRVEAVVVANMRAETLSTLLNPELQNSSGDELYAVDPQGLLITAPLWAKCLMRPLCPVPGHSEHPLTTPPYLPRAAAGNPALLPSPAPTARPRLADMTSWLISTGWSSRRNRPSVFWQL